MRKYPTEKCKTCDRYNHEAGRVSNRLRCLVDCDDLRIEHRKRAIEYNLAVSDGDIQKYEMGREVLGYKETHGSQRGSEDE